MLWCALSVCLVLLAVYYILIKPFHYWSDRDVFTNKPTPIVGHMGSYVSRKKHLIYWTDEIYKSCNGRYLGVYQFLQPILLLKDIDLIKQITIKDNDSFMNRRTFITKDVDPLFGRTLMSLRDQKWKDMRAKLSPAFTGSKMRGMFLFMQECAKQFVDHYTQNASANETSVMEMKDVFTRFANDVIATCAFGIKCNSFEERANEFYIMGKNISDFGGVRSLLFLAYSISPKIMNLVNPFPMFAKSTSDYFRNIIWSNIATREREGIVRLDMIHLLMQAKKGQLHFDESKTDNEQETGFATATEASTGKHNTKIELSDDDLTAQAVLFFIAGFETIATVLCLMSYELALNPDVQKKLQEEIDATLEKHKDNITYDVLVKMKYLDMVMSETLRLWPTLGLVDRVCNSPYTIEPNGLNEKPVHLVKGDVVVVPIFGIHRDPQYYPNPEKFDPERFNEENKKNIKPCTYLPFGIGSRNCIASRFALLEMKTVLLYLLSKFEIVVVEKTQIPLQFKKLNFFLFAEKGYWLGLKLRQK